MKIYKRRMIYYFIFLTIILIIQSQCMGQNGNISYFKRKDIRTPELETKYPPFYYSHIPISFKLLNIDTSNLIIIGENVKIDNYHKYFNINGTSQYNKGKIHIYKKDEKNKLQKYWSFDLIGINPPIILSFNNYKSFDFIKYDDFINGRLIAKLENFDINLSFNIISYTLITNFNDTIVSISTNVNKCNYDDDITENCSFFSNDQLECINKFKKKQIVVFKDVIIEMGKNEYKTLDPIIFYIYK